MGARAPHTSPAICPFVLGPQGDRVPEKGDGPAPGAGGVGAGEEGGDGQTPGQGGPWEKQATPSGFGREKGPQEASVSPFCFPDLRTGRKPANTAEFQFHLTGSTPLPLSPLPCPQHSTPHPCQPGDRCPDNPFPSSFRDQQAQEAPQWAFGRHRGPAPKASSLPAHSLLLRASLGVDRHRICRPNCQPPSL